MIEDKEWRNYVDSDVEVNEGKYPCIKGCVYTNHGIVSVYSQGDDATLEITFMDYCLFGRRFRRRIFKGYKKRYLITLARRFAMEVFEREFNKKFVKKLGDRKNA